MRHDRINVTTRDGVCPADLLVPDGDGPWPSVLFFMDGLGIRPTLVAMAERIVRAGHVVLLPDLYYRAGEQAPEPIAGAPFDEQRRARIGALMATTGNDRAGSDSAAFIDHLLARPDTTDAVGAVGYCMGGGMALTVAGLYPAHVRAAASFHGSALATDRPDSPHLLAPRMAGRIYVGAAEADPYCPPEMIARLEAAFDRAGTSYRCEIYAGARHGWTMTDLPMFDAGAAERHWDTLLGLFRATLR